MKEHVCPNATKIERIEKILYGNGHAGLVENIARLDENVKILCETDKHLSTTVSALVKFMSESKGTEKERKNHSTGVKWLIGISSTIILGLATIIISLLTNLSK